jgi:hypothetical protein
MWYTYRMAIDNTHLIKHLKNLRACRESLAWLGDRDSASMWLECNNPAWLLWYAARNGATRHQLVGVACKISRTVLKYVPVGEDRPRICIDTVERWLAGMATIEEVKEASKDSYAVCVGDAAANAAAEATAYAAAGATAYAAVGAAAANAAAKAAAAAYAAAGAAAGAAYVAAYSARAEQYKLSCSIIREMWPTCPEKAA